MVKLNKGAIINEMYKNNFNRTKLAERMGTKLHVLSTILSRGTCNEVNAGKMAAALGVPVETIAILD